MYRTLKKTKAYSAFSEQPRWYKRMGFRKIGCDVRKPKSMCPVSRAHEAWKVAP